MIGIGIILYRTMNILNDSQRERYVKMCKDENRNRATGDGNGCQASVISDNPTPG